ncbi:MAG: dNTP triphosphohydrolase [bacterium]|nr:dNTP triphosphohydrolase [bacterium]
MSLAPYACDENLANIRREYLDPFEGVSDRSPFERDRDRILHSPAFRRLAHKTQLFIYSEGDHYRTRLTHTLEATSVAKRIGKTLGLNLMLIEATVFGHDLGQPPFGHAGERALSEIMKTELKLPGFKHNHQGVRVVRKCIFQHFHLKKDSPEKMLRGLNLTDDTIEGILFHTNVDKKLNNFQMYKYLDIVPERINSYTLEGQVVAIADEIAQIFHDCEDGLKHKMISLEEVLKSKLYLVAKESWNKQEKNNEYITEVIKMVSTPTEEDKLSSRYQGVREAVLSKSLRDFLIYDVIKTTKEKINGHGELKTRKIATQVVDFSPLVKEAYLYFKKEIIEKKVYNDRRLITMDIRGSNAIKILFQLFNNEKKLLPDEVFEEYNLISGELGENYAKIILIDYISGMTDRYALMMCKDLLPYPIEF